MILSFEISTPCPDGNKMLTAPISKKPIRNNCVELNFCGNETFWVNSNFRYPFYKVVKTNFTSAYSSSLSDIQFTVSYCGFSGGW